MYPLALILSLISVALAAAAGLLIRSEYERRHPVIHEYHVRSPKIPECASGLRIAYLSDLHGDNPGKAKERMEELVRNCGADLVLVGGDMLTVHQGHSYREEPFRRLLHAVPEGVPVYFADGNHEIRMAENPELYPGWKEAYDRMLKEEGVIRLKNQRIRLDEDKFGGIILSAADLPEDTYTQKFRKKALPENYFERLLGKKPQGFEIMLVHSPLYFREACSDGADLVLSGHFHGGTIRIFGTGLMTPQFQFLNRYCRGIFRFGDSTGISGGGLGTHSVNIRFMNRPEIVVVTLDNCSAT